MEGISITDRETQQWQQIGEEVVASEEIKRVALQYYLEYRQYLVEKNLDKTYIYDNGQLANLFRAAYLLSQKKQETFNLKGEKINAVVLSVNGILKKSHNYEEFLYHLKEMMKVATINDRQLENDVLAFTKSFAFTITFINKFISTFQKIKPLSQDATLEQSLLWLLFILSKKLLFQQKNDIIETQCLIAILFIYYIRQKNRLAQGKVLYILDDHAYGGKLNKESVEHTFLQYFRLKDMASYSQVLYKFNELLDEISPSNVNLFDPETLEFTYKHFDKLYQKKLTQQCIDERHFLKDRRNTVLNANRFTPFGGRRTAAKIKNTETINKIMSHRILNYEKGDDESQDGSSTETSGSGLLKNLTLTKTPYTTLIKMTPMTMAMQMHNWALEKSSYYKFEAGEFPKFLMEESSEKCQKMINGLWKDICMCVGEKSELTQTDKKAYLLLAAQIIHYIINSTANPIQNIRTLLGVSWFSLWSKIDTVLRYDERMPTNIKVHLLSLQTTIICTHLWKEESILFSIFRAQMGAKLRQTNPDYERLFRRIIHQLVYQIYFLSKKLELRDETINHVFHLSQYTINTFPDLCLNRNLNHVVLCSSYAVCKALDQRITFHSILTSFKELNNLNKDAYNDVLEKISLDGQFVDIITFYNKVYIKKTREFLLSIKYESMKYESQLMPEIGKEFKIEKGNKNYIHSTVKDLLPQEMVVMAEKITKTPGNQTPLTQALLAYNESPLLRQKRLKNIGNYVDGKRLLQKKEWSKEESLTSASNMISKKFGSKKSVDMRGGKKMEKG